MINTKYLASYFTNLLNQYGESYGKHFKVFADEGELKKAVKSYGKAPVEYTSGIVEIIGSSLTPIRDIRLNTYSIQLTLFVDLALNGYNQEKESLNLIDIRNLLTNLVEEINGSTTFETVGDITYSQSVTISYPTNGTKGNVGDISDCLPLYITCNIAMFEDGLNANNCSIAINDVEIPFTRAVFTRKRTADASTFNGVNSQQVVMQANGLSVDIVMPALTNNDVSNLIMKDILTGGNYALNVKIHTPIIDKIFIGTFGDTQASLDIATNIGYNLSIVEAFPYILDYNFDEDIWGNDIIAGDYSYLVEDGLPKNTTYHWGDGNADEYPKNYTGIIAHEYADGKQAHTLKIFYGG